MDDEQSTLQDYASQIRQLVRDPANMQRFREQLRRFIDDYEKAMADAERKAKADPKLRDQTQHPGDGWEWLDTRPGLERLRHGEPKGYYRPLNIGDKMLWVTAPKGGGDFNRFISPPTTPPPTGDEYLLIHYLVAAAVHDRDGDKPPIAIETNVAVTQYYPTFSDPPDADDRRIITDAIAEVEADLESLMPPQQGD